MPITRNYKVWTWFFADERPAYVGWGWQPTGHPAETLWQNRYLFDSDLNLWLRKQIVEPKRVDHARWMKYASNDAIAHAASLRDKYASEGHRMLNPRPHGTKAGGGGPRQVLSPDMAIHKSVRAAATEFGVNPCSITRWCQDDKNTEWNYLN